MRRIWNSKKWRENSKAFLKDKICEWCGSKDALIPHHKTYLNLDGSMMSDNDIIDLEGHAYDIIVLCKRCNYANMKGRVLCQRCKKNYHGKSYSMCLICSKEFDDKVKPCPKMNECEHFNGDCDSLTLCPFKSEEEIKEIYKILKEFGLMEDDEDI